MIFAFTAALHASCPRAKNKTSTSVKIFLIFSVIVIPGQVSKLQWTFQHENSLITFLKWHGRDSYILLLLQFKTAPLTRISGSRIFANNFATFPKP